MIEFIIVSVIGLVIMGLGAYSLMFSNDEVDAFDGLMDKTIEKVKKYWILMKDSVLGTNAAHKIGKGVEEAGDDDEDAKMKKIDEENEKLFNSISNAELLDNSSDDLQASTSDVKSVSTSSRVSIVDNASSSDPVPSILDDAEVERIESEAKKRKEKKDKEQSKAASKSIVPPTTGDLNLSILPFLEERLREGEEENKRNIKIPHLRCGNAKCKNYNSMINANEADKSAIKLSSCSQCKTVYYCGKDCQTEDWNVHKTRCKLIHACKKDNKFPLYGVSLKWFLSNQIGEKIMDAASVDEAVENVLLPLTMNHKCSVAEWLLKTSPECVKPVADTFVSHCWSSPGSELVNSLLNELEVWCGESEEANNDIDIMDDDNENNNVGASASKKDVFIWIDILCLNQHEKINRNKEFWDKLLPETFKAINHTTLLVNTWRNPTAFTRSWCLLEVLLHAGSMRLGMSKEEREELWKEIRRDDIRRVFAAVGNRIEFANARARDKDVEEHLMKVVKEWKGGIDGLVMQFGNGIRTFLIEEALIVISKIEKEIIERERSRGQKIAEIIAREDDAREIFNMYLKMHFLNQTSGMSDESERWARKAIKIGEKIFGKNDIRTAQAREMIAISMSHQKRADESLVELIECIRVYKFHNHEQLMTSCYNNLGYVYQSKGMLKESSNMFGEVIKIYKNNPQVHAQNPEIVDAFDQQANMLYNLGDFTTAKDNLIQATSILQQYAPTDQRLVKFQNGIKQMNTKLGISPTSTSTASSKSIKSR